MKSTIGVILSLVMLLSAGCATSNQQAQTSALLGAIGAGAGAALDGGDRWRGALIGGLAGMATGYGLATINQTNQQQQPVLPLPPPGQKDSAYYTPGGYYYPSGYPVYQQQCPYGRCAAPVQQNSGGYYTPGGYYQQPGYPVYQNQNPYGHYPSSATPTGYPVYQQQNPYGHYPY